MEKKTDMLKFEIARELGLAEKVLKFGWKSLSAKETGRIGGLVSKKRKAFKEAKQEHI
jgi:small acid-soluble spore protein F (minor alpha/beta-type SASP)